MRKQRHPAYTNCPVEAALDLIGGKWKSMILFRTLEATRRFNEMRRLLPGLTQRMLTNQLRELERDGLISRKVYAEVPPKVEYSITAFGRTLEPVLLELKQWAEAQVLPRMHTPTAVTPESPGMTLTTASRGRRKQPTKTVPSSARR